MNEIYDRITSLPSSIFEFRFGKVTKKFSGWLIPIADRTEFFAWRKTLTSNVPEVYKPKGRDNAGWYIVDSVLPTKSAKREVKTLKRDLSLSIHNKHFTYKKDVYAYCKKLAESVSIRFLADDDLFLRELFTHHPDPNKLQYGVDYFYSKLNEYGTGYEFWFVDKNGRHDDISYNKTVNAIYSKKLGK